MNFKTGYASTIVCPSSNVLNEDDCLYKITSDIEEMYSDFKKYGCKPTKEQIKNCIKTTMKENQIKIEQQIKIEK